MSSARAHSWFYDSVRNNEFREGWIDEGITSYLASDELLYQDLESYKTEKQYGADGSREVYTNARNEVRSKSEADFLKGRKRAMKCAAKARRIS